MAWVPISIDDLFDGKAAALVEALRSAALDPSQTDPLPRIISNVVAQVRAQVATCPSNRLDADASKVPENLKALTVRLVLWEARSRLAAVGAILKLTEQDRIDHTDDLALLRRVANCQARVSETNNPEPLPTTVQQPGGVELVHSSPSPATSTGLNAL